MLWAYSWIINSLCVYTAFRQMLDSRFIPSVPLKKVGVLLPSRFHLNISIEMNRIIASFHVLTPLASPVTHTWQTDLANISFHRKKLLLSFQNKTKHAFRIPQDSQRNFFLVVQSRSSISMTVNSCNLYESWSNHSSFKESLPLCKNLGSINLNQYESVRLIPANAKRFLRITGLKYNNKKSISN